MSPRNRNSRYKTLMGQLTAVFAVATLPLGILAAAFVSLSAALVVFVVGWLFLTPLSAILAGNSVESEVDDEVEQFVQERVRERLNEKRETESSTDPLEELRARYARGEIDETELERRLDALLETEDVDPADEQSIERAIANLDTESDEVDSHHDREETRKTAPGELLSERE